MKVTIYDVAEKSGVNISTVSRALDPGKKGLISEKTRNRVIEAARALAYYPDTAARALMTGKMMTIGLVVQSLEERTDSQFAEMLRSAEPAARKLGYRVAVFGELDAVLQGRIVDGIITLADPGDEVITRIAEHGMPAIYVCPRPASAGDSVAWSDQDGVYKGVEYLHGLGHRRIAGIFGDLPVELQERSSKLQGFRDAVRDLKIDSREYFADFSPDQFENGYLIGRSLLTDVQDFSAIITRNDFLAFGVMKALREAGIETPADMSVLGYSDSQFARCSDPALTSVHTPIAAAGEIAVSRVIDMINGEEVQDQGVVLPVSVTVRDSCRQCSR